MINDFYARQILGLARGARIENACLLRSFYLRIPLCKVGRFLFAFACGVHWFGYQGVKCVNCVAQGGDFVFFNTAGFEFDGKKENHSQYQGAVCPKRNLFH